MDVKSQLPDFGIETTQQHLSDGFNRYPNQHESFATGVFPLDEPITGLTLRSQGWGILCLSINNTDPNEDGKTSWNLFGSKIGKWKEDYNTIYIQQTEERINVGLMLTPEKWNEITNLIRKKMN